MDRAVLLIGNFLTQHGAARQVCEDLAPRLEADGWRVITVSSRSGRLSRLADMVLTITARRRDYGVALVDVFSGPSFVWAEAACLALAAMRKPIVLTMHGGNLPTFARRHPHRVQRLLGMARAVTAPSAFLADALAPYRTGIQVLPNGIDLASYPFRVRRDPQPRLVWVRSMHAMYDPAVAIRVLSLVSRRHPQASLDMVGPDKGDGSLAGCRRLAEDLGVLDLVRFVGGVAKDQVPNWLSRSDFFLNTTTVDNAPVSVVEAMACGLIVVSTNAGGLPNLIDHGRTGYLLPVGDAQGMADIIIKACGGETGARAVSEAGHMDASSRDWPCVVAQWRGLLQEVGA